MRHLLAAGGLAIAASACGLLFSGAAFARQASDTITVAGSATGPTSIKFSGYGSAISGVGFYPGSNFKWTSVSSAGGNCQILVTNGFAYCSYPQPGVTSFVVTTTINGTLPTAIAGQVVYADSSTGPFTAPVTSATPGKPFINHAFLSRMKTGHPRLGFTLHQGQNAPKLESFSIGLPNGLSFNHRKLTYGLELPLKWKCDWQTKEKLSCNTKAPASAAKALFWFPALDESNALETKVKDGKIMKLPVRFKITDVRRWETVLTEDISVH
jgi:hypothetical protein